MLKQIHYTLNPLKANGTDQGFLHAWCCPKDTLGTPGRAADRQREKRSPGFQDEFLQAKACLDTDIDTDIDEMDMDTDDIDTDINMDDTDIDDIVLDTDIDMDDIDIDDIVLDTDIDMDDIDIDVNPHRPQPVYP